MTTHWWQLDWVWIASGWVLLSLGAVLLGWSLFWDRARGRRRCPKCWYDMAGVPTTARDGRDVHICPECGRVIARECGLRRTRRKWRVAVPSALAVVCGWGLTRVPQALSGGWVRVVPATVLAFYAPTGYSGSAQMALRPKTAFAALPAFTGIRPPPPTPWRQTLGEEAWRRIYAHEMWQWQSQEFLGRAIRDRGTDLGDFVTLPQRWIAGEQVPLLISDRGLSGSWGLRLVWWAGDGKSLWPVPREPVSLDAAGPANQGHVDIHLALTQDSASTALGQVRRGSPPEFFVYTCTARRPIALVPRLEDIFHTDASAATTERVLAALDPRLCIAPDGAVTLVLDDRAADNRWMGLRMGLGCLVEIRLDGVLVASGAHRPQWTRAVFKDWEELTLKWAEGGKARVLASPERIRVRVKGDIQTSWEIYREWPFADTDPSCWTGEFGCTPRVVARPEKFTK